MSNFNVTDSVIYTGCDDKTLDLFEGQYVIPNGVSYNSYIVMGEKTVVMDSVDKRAAGEWLNNLETALSGKQPDYLVISHMEPDHGGSLESFIKKYPNTKIVGNAKTFVFFKQFFNMDITDKTVVVKDGDELDLGGRSLKFIFAPMVHWPEVMMTYDSKDKILFSADAFGKFGALDTDEDWACEARRYYMNIVGKYGAQVQAALKKAAALDIAAICPLHGPVIKENIAYYVNKYDIWSSYKPEDEGVTVVYGSIYGGTAKAAEKLAEIIRAKGVKASVFDLARDDMAEAIEDSFRYGRLVVASVTYDGGLMPCVEDYLHHLKIKSFQSRRVGFIENGTWAPMAGKLIKAYFEGMKNITVCENNVTIKSALKDETALEKLAEDILSD